MAQDLADKEWPVVADILALEAEAQRLAVERLREQKFADPGPNNGECCYGNYDDAHGHGYELGWNAAIDAALAHPEEEQRP